MEMPVRLRFPPDLWMRVTTVEGLYYLFGRIGAVIDVAAVILPFLLLAALRAEPRARGFTLAAALLMAAGLVLWFALVQPMNAVMATWQPPVVPSDFEAVRQQWEFGHFAIAVVKLAAFSALVLSVLVRQPAEGQAAGSGRRSTRARSTA
jgi:hypothetical protein